MDKLIQTIQEQINLLMNSKCAKFSDKQLQHFEGKEKVTKETAIQIIDEYKKSNSTLGSILKTHGVKHGTFANTLERYGIETPARNIRKGGVKPPSYDERKNDIISGMKVNDWCLKWEGFTRHTYYQIKKKLEKDLAVSE